MQMFNYLVVVLTSFLFLIPAFIIWLVAIIDCLSSKKLDPSEKFFWIIVIFILHLVGAIIYLVYTKMVRKNIFKSIKGRKLTRSKKNRIVAGICSGFANYFDMDPTVVRVLWVVLSFLGFGTGVLLYLIFWIIIPEK